MCALSRWRTVMSRHDAGPLVKYFEIGSANDTRPSCTCSITTVAVNCLPSEPDWKIVRSVTGTLCSTLASP